MSFSVRSIGRSKSDVVAHIATKLEKVTEKDAALACITDALAPFNDNLAVDVTANGNLSTNGGEVSVRITSLGADTFAPPVVVAEATK